MEHKLEMQAGFIEGFDAYCNTCFDPDYDGGWSGVEGIYNATEGEVNEWYAEHVRLSAK